MAGGNFIMAWQQVAARQRTLAQSSSSRTPSGHHHKFAHPVVVQQHSLRARWSERPFPRSHHSKSTTISASSDRDGQQAAEKGSEPGAAKATTAEGGKQYDAKYYAGMLASPLSAEDRNKQLSENRDGLKQNLKFVSIAALIIGGLFIAFMSSNGLI